MITERAAEHWNLELDDLFLTIGHRFRRVELRRRMRDYVRGLLAPVARKNSRQPACSSGQDRRGPYSSSTARSQESILSPGGRTPYRRRCSATNAARIGGPVDRSP
ncbi:hypothetical protein [Streptomyces sp. NPDC059460]|uniref:hypothetical protein n=1 Tax=Streptomyces sp. NPDC059460 TaxID=3346840 RepID=UPI0036BD698F